MDKMFLALQDMYRSLLAEELPTKESHEVACIICSNICNPWSVNAHAAEKSRESNGQNSSEMVCFVLSLMESMSCKVLSGSTAANTRLYYMEVLTVSLDHMSVMSKLVSLFGVSDRLLSHFAVKCATSLVLFQLHKSNSFNRVWQEKCMKILLEPFPSIELYSTLWSLTALIKGILTGMCNCNKDALEQLVSMLDSVFPQVYSGLLSWVERGQGSAASVKDMYNVETSLVAFLDFLEVLTAARLSLKICFFRQRLFYQQALMTLQLVGSSVQYFVQKKAILLLKATLLLKAGEDFITVGPPLMKEGDHMITDLLSLADVVLQAVFAGWLQGVPVNTNASFFGGNVMSVHCASDGPDFVVLRAVSLILLKSLEYKLQYEKEGPEPAGNLPAFLGALMLFLKQHLSGLQQLLHPCSWVSLVFGEQDDDMIEAAKVIMMLHLYQRRWNTGENLKACETGCNPHCHFIFLLQNVAFDHSVLLDFLISTETCFLDYFVRYLKLLRNNWEDFAAICQGIEALNSKAGFDVAAFERDRVGAPGGCTSKGSNDRVSETLPNPGTANRRNSTSLSLGISQPISHPLVDYESSDESESEEPGLSSVPLQRTLVSDGSGFENAKGDGQSECCSLTQEKSVVGPSTPSRLCVQAVTCLGQLRTVICRLQRRNLFPYKPDSLLKLLMQIEEKSGIQYEFPCE
ncbi:protein Lines homolog 1 [Scleropages formosus]|uniref:protein Lines homolog 1 n=1 Tax=Scleropages formosus TaxID=113540 RepID=UPI0010FA86F2|nr:protein Lines homolog 1 [Scleropages formosus]